MTREDKQSVISICRILADKMDDSGKVAVQNVISAVERMKEQEQNLDAINRKTAIKTIDSWLSCDDYNEAEREIMRAARSMLLGLPSVTPNQKTGHWVQAKRPFNFRFKCSECGRPALKSERNGNDVKSKYCPRCGARMESEATSGESYEGEFEAMEHNGRMDAVESDHD